MAAQRRMQLLAPDIDGEHPAGAVGEQHLGEAAGRRADVETDVILDVERMSLQRARQLDAAARDIGMRRLRAEFGVGGDKLGGFQHRSVVGDDQTGFDRGLGAGPAFEQPALDQQQVRALAGKTQVRPSSIEIIEYDVWHDLHFCAPPTNADMFRKTSDRARYPRIPSVASRGDSRGRPAYERSSN